MVLGEHSPVTVAIYAHGMAAAWQDHFGADLQTNATFIRPVQILIRRLLPVFNLLPANNLLASAPPLTALSPFHQTALQLLKRGIYNSCSI